jgi:hypothetical protein
MQVVHCVYLSIEYRLRLNPLCIYFLTALALSHYIDLRIVFSGQNLRLMMRVGKDSWLSFMSSVTNHNENYNTFVQMAVCTVQFFIWECKLKKHKPSWAACKEFTVEILKNMCQNSRFFNGERIKSNCSLSRRW